MGGRAATTPAAAAPARGPAGVRADLRGGFLVLLITLPLCLGIAAACGYSPVVGALPAVPGGLICMFVRNSQMTVMGPAGGLILIARGR